VWFFRSPEIAFGEGALDYLEEVQGRRAFIVTDESILALGFVRRVQAKLSRTGIESAVFAEVEPNPSMETVQRGAEAIRAYEPDWIIALGGGSCIDAAKSIWILYERPDLAPDEVAPVGRLGLRRKARLIAIPTTSGSGAEGTWPIVLTDTFERRKISVGHPENIPDIAIIDPTLAMELPAQITADTGMDILSHAVEGYTSQWHSDFTDGLCLNAIRLVLEFLPHAYERGSSHPQAREKMHNAATIAGLGFSNSAAAMAHGLGHALGALFPVPHGRAVGLFLPYTVEFTVRGDLPTRYAEIAGFLGLSPVDEAEGAAHLTRVIRDLAHHVGQPTSLQEAGICAEDCEGQPPRLIDNALNESATVLGLRFPGEGEVERILRYAFEGQWVDF
jgi:alcohol dehydrogenase class IV